MLQAIRGVPEFVLRALNAMPVSDMRNRFEREYCLFTGPERAALTGAMDYGRAVERISYWLDWSAGQAGADGAERMMSIDSRMGLADDLLLYGDKISMAHSLEARVPMLDLELVRFVESLPRAYRLSLRQGKIVHKRAAGGFLPADIVHRTKKAFPMPFGTWVRTVWKERAHAVLFHPEAPHLQWIRAAGLRRIWDEHQSGARDRSRQIFALLAFAFWCVAMEGCMSKANGDARHVMRAA
jgi:asparagine synthase (glutamine-hydrolysing)